MKHGWIFLGYFIFLEADAENTESIYLRLQFDTNCRHYVQFAYFIYGAHTKAIYGETMDENNQVILLFSVLRDGGKSPHAPVYLIVKIKSRSIFLFLVPRRGGSVEKTFPKECNIKTVLIFLSRILMLYFAGP